MRAWNALHSSLSWNVPLQILARSCILLCMWAAQLSPNHFLKLTRHLSWLVSKYDSFSYFFSFCTQCIANPYVQYETYCYRCYIIVQLSPSRSRRREISSALIPRWLGPELMKTIRTPELLGSISARNWCLWAVFSGHKSSICEC